MHVLCVAGARPNFVKIKPILSALEDDGIHTTFVHSGQHYDDGLSGAFLRDLGLRAPDHMLSSGSGSHAEQTARVMLALEPVILDAGPDLTVVVGDVNTTVAAALVSAKLGVPVAHVEAGLRSGDRSMPEEINRIVTDRISDLLFAPSADAVDNLLREGMDGETVHMVGNVMIDSLMACRERAAERPILRELALEERSFALVTLHRPSNVDDPGRLEQILSALRELSRSLPVVLPAHPRLRAALARLEATAEGVQILDPLGYLDFLRLEMASRILVTDSGGIQEEATVLGVPCLTLRDTTERPVTLEGGVNQLIGTDPTVIVSRAREAMQSVVEPFVPPLWDGRAAERIVTVLRATIGVRS